MLIAPLPPKKEELGRLGIVAGPDASEASFSATPVEGGYRLVSNSKAFRGHVVTVTNRLQGACSANYDAPSSDVVLVPASDPLASSAASVWAVVKPPPSPPPPPPPVPYSPWVEYTAPGVSATFTSDTSSPFHGLASQKITLSSVSANPSGHKPWLTRLHPRPRQLSASSATRVPA